MSADAMLAAAAALGIAGVAWPFFGYGRALRLLAARRPIASPGAAGAMPECVTVLLAVHNERTAVEARLRNLFDTDFPADGLRVVVASDGSTDGTDDVVRAWPDPRVSLVRSEPRAGKSIAQNAGLAAIGEGVVVITDCGTAFDRRTIPELVAPFADPRVGVVDGALRFEPPPGAQAIRAHGAYWDYEGSVRSCESRLGILATASGAVMAARREVIGALPGHAGDDCVVPLMAVAAGLRVHRANAALAWDESNSDPRAEFRSRVRMVVRNWQGTWMFPGLLAPWRRPGVAFGLWSHKLLRWLAPVSVLVALGALAALAALEGGAWAWIAGGAWALALAGGAEAAATWGTRGRYRASPLGSFALVCTAFGVGLAKVAAGHRIGGYRDRTASVARAALLAAAVLAASTVRADGPRLPEGWQSVALRRATEAGSVVSPIVVASSADQRIAYCAAGGGESFPGGGVWALGMEDGKPLHPELQLGRNCSALRCVGHDGSTVVAAWRGSRQVAAIDAGAWRIRASEDLGFVPMDVAVEGDRAWVVGFTPLGRGAVAAFRVEQGILRPESRCTLEEPAHRAAVVGGMLVVTEPVGGFVEWLDPGTLVRRARFDVGPSPVAIASADGVALVATREGELLEVDGSKGLRRRTDLAAAFGIDPGQRALRDLDPTDVIALPGGRAIVGTYRVDGFVVAIGEGGVRPLARIPSAVRHHLVSADGDTATLLLGRKEGVTAVTVDLAGAVKPKSRFVARSDAVRSWAPLPGPDGGVAVSTVLGGSVQVLSPGRVGHAALALEVGSGTPSCMAADGAGRVLAVAVARAGGHQVTPLPADAAHPPVELAGARAPSWIGSSGGQALVLDRLQAKAWLVADATATGLSAPRTRPRAATRLADGGWIVIHDTNPDVGCSRLADGAWKDFAPIKEGSWPSAIAAMPGARTACFVTFNGMLCEVGPDLRVVRHRDLGLAGASSIAIDPAGRIGVASENAGTGLLLGGFGADPAEFRTDGLQAVVPQADGTVALVTLTGVDFVRRAQAAPPPPMR